MPQRPVKPVSLETQLTLLALVPLVCLTCITLFAILGALSEQFNVFGTSQKHIGISGLLYISGLLLLWAIASAWFVVQQRRIKKQLVNPIKHLSSALRSIEKSTTKRSLTTDPTTIPELLDLYQSVSAVIREIATVRQLNLRLMETNASKEDAVVEVARLQLESELESLTDALTQVSNRRCLERDFPIALEQSMKNGTQLCFAMCDIDHFKHFNDTYGHQTGDEVLQHFAAILKDGFRDTDHVYRYGGEEFGIILRKADLQLATLACDRIRSQVEHSFQERNLSVTASFGVAMYEPAVSTLEELVSRADQALYRAKEGGRNRVESAPTSSVLDPAQQSTSSTDTAPSESPLPDETSSPDTTP